ncbi:MAG: hypothetical protein JSS79_21300, partial [Bacteroidetes bacterium]|nr:hypothetical protein [Bacteroidota bacterium]
MKAKYYVRSLMFISLFLGQGVMAAPAYFRSVASGNWSSLSTWQQSADNVTWVSATEYPLQTGSTNTITLQSPYTVTLDVSLSYALSALTINSGATLKDISTTPTTSFSTSSLTISGTINFTYNNVYLNVNNGTINASASLTGYRLYFSGGTLTNNGTITALGSPGCIDSQVLGSTTFAGTGTFNFNGLSIHNNSTLTSNISGVFNESCVFNIYSGSFVAGASSTAVYNLTAINNVVTSIFNTSNIHNTKQVIIGGNVTNNGTFTAGSATTKNSTLSGASNIQFNDTLKVNTGFETKNSGTVTVSTMLTGTGAFTQNTNSTLNYGGATLLIAALNATATGNTVNYFASANQTIANFSYYNLTLSGTTNKTKSLSGPGTILGTVSIQNNSIFSCGGFDLSVGGDWNNSSTNTNAFVASTKSVTFNGSSSQNIINSGSANGTRFNNLIINNISPSIPQISLSLSGNPLTILNSLNMISGVVNYNSNSVQLGSTSASANTLIHSGSASSGWFYTTNASGSFLRYFQTGVAVANGSLPGLLPVGTSTDFRPIYISCPTTPPTTNTTMKVTQLGASTTTTIVNIADNPGSNIVRQYQGSWPIVPNTTTGTYNITAGGTGFGTIGNVSDLRLSLAASVVGTAGTNSGTTTFPLVLRTGLSSANLNNTFYLGSV